jgi:hypothetical protein
VDRRNPSDGFLIFEIMNISYAGLVLPLTPQAIPETACWLSTALLFAVRRRRNGSVRGRKVEITEANTATVTAASHLFFWIHALSH